MSIKKPLEKSKEALSGDTKLLTNLEEPNSECRTKEKASNG